MSQEPNSKGVTAPQATEVIEVLKEEQFSPALSSLNMNNPKVSTENYDSIAPCTDCTCLERDEKLKEKMDPDLVQTLLREKEKRLTEDFQEHLKNEVNFLKERCDFIIKNEQVRASYMLREAHRERQEKVTALQTQLECKNMAGLMFVMCSERRKSKLEKMKLVQEYTNYIHALQDILTEAQNLILHLSKGYKTAARVDYEWRDKMKKVLKEFQMFVHDFAGGTPEGGQYFFDVPVLLKTEASIVDDPIEDPCESEEEAEKVDTEVLLIVIDIAILNTHNLQNTIAEKLSKYVDLKNEITHNEDKPWWERMDSDCRPFLMFGDMAEFKPPQRREVLHNLKAAKTAPRKWKEYVFNEMFIKADCANADYIKDEYNNHLPNAKWECHSHPSAEQTDSKMSLASHRVTRVSEDIRGNMGSILKIMTSNNFTQPVTKATILGARDSMEIASTTKLREHEKQKTSHTKVVINVGTSNNRRTSFFDEVRHQVKIDDVDDTPDDSRRQSKEEDEEESPDEVTLGSTHHDSLQVMTHQPDQDHKIHYEKVCPMEKCKRLQVDSFIRSLPPYMRANPFTHFEQNYEEYEACSPEQLEILMERIKRKKTKSEREGVEESPLAEWTPSIEGVAVQTSELSVSLPPCTCRVPSPSLVSSNGQMFNVRDLIPVKQAFDTINKDCLYDDRIQFDRFKVLGMMGEESKTNMADTKPVRESNKIKVQEIRKILKQHPSLLDIFQANTQC